MPSRLTYFTQISGNFTPALNGSLAAFYMQGEQMLLIMPSVSYEIKENLDAMVLAQSIYNEINKKTSPMGLGTFFRISYSFQSNLKKP